MALTRSGLSRTHVRAVILRWKPKASGNWSQDWKGPVATEEPLRVKTESAWVWLPLADGRPASSPHQNCPPAALLSLSWLAWLSSPLHPTLARVGKSSEEGPGQAPWSHCQNCPLRAQPESQETTC